MQAVLEPAVSSLEGWLLDQLKLQAAGLSGHLDEFWPDLGPKSGWLGGPGESWERGPYFMDGLVPLASVPTQIAGRNRMWRKMIIDSIRGDPAWNGGDYARQPPGLEGAMTIQDFGAHAKDNTVRLGSGSALSLAAQIVGLGASFIVGVVVARVLGVATHPHASCRPGLPRSP